jgi:hypothetical protein
MKKIRKVKGLFDYKFRFIHDERLNNLDEKALAPNKLAEANKHLKKMRSLPK